MKFNSNKITIFTIAAVMVLFIGISFFACENFVPNNAATALVNQPNEALSGGATTVFDQSVNAFALPVPTLSSQDELLFFVGNSFFNQNWVQAPSSTTARDGLSFLESIGLVRRSNGFSDP